MDLRNILAALTAMFITVGSAYAFEGIEVKGDGSSASFYENGMPKHAEGDVCIRNGPHHSKCYKNSIVEFTDKGTVKNVKKRTAANAAATAKNTLTKVCAADIQAKCADKKGKAVKACLKAAKDKLSPECSAKM